MVGQSNAMAAGPLLPSDPLAEARRLLLHGWPSRASRIAEELTSAGESAWERAAGELVSAQVTAMTGRPRDAQAYLVHRSERWLSDVPAISAAMRVEASIIALLRGDSTECLAHAVQAQHMAQAAGDRAAQLAGLALLGAQVANGLTDRSADLATMVQELLDVGIPAELPLLPVAAVTAVVRADISGRSVALLDRLHAAVRAESAAGLEPWLNTVRALLEHRRGDWEKAEALAGEALRGARSSGQQAVIPYATAIVAIADAVTGRTESCRRRCVEMLGTEAMAIPVVRLGVLSALGLLEMGESRMHEAVRWFEVLAGGPGPVAKADPGLVMWGPDLVEAYVGVGRHDRATAVLARLEAQARSAPSVRVQAAVARCRALISSDREEAMRLFAEAIAGYHAPEFRFARGRMELARAERLARDGNTDAALAGLEEALRLFDEIGARGWARRARVGLDRLRPGQTLEPSTSLIAMEERVVMAAALGGSVTDIAEGMFLSEEAARRLLRSAASKLAGDAPGGEDRGGGRGEGRGEGRPPTDAARTAAAAAPGLGSPGPGRSSERGSDKARFSLELLGHFEITAEGVAVRPPVGVAGLAVKFVALKGKVTVEQLIDVLWPEAAPSAGRQRLRSLLNRVRTGIGPVIERRGDWVALSEGCRVDVHCFEHAARAATASVEADPAERRRLAEAALGCYGGDLLPSDRYSDFTVSPRERLRRLYRSVVAVAVDAATRLGDVDRAVLLLEDVMGSEPYDEDAYTQAAEILERAGRRAEALSVMRRAESALAELGLPLSARARELATRCRPTATT